MARTASHRVLALVACALAACATSAYGTPAGRAPVLLWSNTESLASLYSAGPGELVSYDRFESMVSRLVHAEAGDFVVLVDGPVSRTSGQVSHLRALKPALKDATSQVAFAGVAENSNGRLLKELVPSVFRKEDIAVTVKAISSIEDLAELKAREGAAPFVFIIDLERLPEPDLAAFSEEGLLDEDPKIFERLTFVSPAIWMGLIAVIIILLILIPAILCTMEIQPPTQFEKKPLLDASQ